MVIVLSMAGSTLFTGIADGQQFQQQPATGNIGRQAQPAGNAPGSPVIQGLEGLRGFGSGHSQLSLAVIPLSQQNNQMAFQLIGFAVSIPESGEAVVYSLESPLPGIIDPSQNTLQIDISNLASAVDTAGYIDSSEVYDTIRTDPHVMVIDVDLNYQGREGSQTIFNVNSVDIIPPDGQMQTFSLQQPTQLIIDTENNLVAMVAFPQMVDTFNNYYGATFDTVGPVIYSQPVAIIPPVFVPYIYPIPIYARGFVSYNRFFFGTGFRTFWDRDRVTHFDRFSNQNRFPVRETRNDFADRSRNDFVAGQRRGEFTQSRQLGTGITGGIGGFRGGVRQGAGGGARIGGGRMGGGIGGGRRR
jgi:hypothetical protein